MSSNDKIKVLVLGASGMLGSAVMRVFSASDRYVTAGTVRSASNVRLLPTQLQNRIISGVDAVSADSLVGLFAATGPKVVINCVGLVKQVAEAEDPIAAIPVNSLLPHRLARLCELADARLVHISTDCVFSGARGGYTEQDSPDAADVYGRSKLLGEVDYPNAVTLRTSIIGHETNSARALIDWFLSQRGSCRGYTRAVFSGLPTVTLARLLRDHVLPRLELRGLYHVSAEPISKHDLLRLVADQYGKSIRIEPNDDVIIDRSLDSTRFRAATGWQPPTWPDLVREMHSFGRSVASVDRQ